jgi:AcrR family transcriptional regulator
MPKLLSEAERLHTVQTIKQVARQQMAEHGAGALSLRGIARAMQMSAPGLYHYFPTFDDLITAMVVDGFSALADAIDAGCQQGASLEARLMNGALAHRAWALTYPTDFQLIYGTPIPGYSAPGEITIPAAIRVFQPTIALLEEGIQTGQIIPHAAYHRPPLPIQERLSTIIESGQYPVSIAALYFGIDAWVRIQGILLMELTDHLHHSMVDAEVYFHSTMQRFYHEGGLQQSHSPP